MRVGLGDGSGIFTGVVTVGLMVVGDGWPDGSVLPTVGLVVLEDTGHGSGLHTVVWLSSCSEGHEPVQVRVRVCVPPPQLAEHSSQLDHGNQVKLDAKISEKIKNYKMFWRYYSKALLYKLNNDYLAKIN